MSRSGVRLSAGSLKGRKLVVPRGVRPTESRVREALFDILGPTLGGGRFLDLFAGTGAVGLEALSRGVSSCVQVDASLDVVRRLRTAYRQLGVQGARCVKLELPGGLLKLVLGEPVPFDWIFADPPYAFDAFPALLYRLGPLAHDETVVILEHDRRHPIPEEAPGWSLDSTHGYGESALSFYGPTR